jgi:hypothetical protein
LKFEKSTGSRILSYENVAVKKMNHIVEVKHVLYNTSGGLKGIKKLNQDSYMILDTGEVKDYVKTENRGQSVACLKDTFRKIRDLINNNFVGGQNEIHLTLTYAENMKDTRRLLDDFKKFWQKYKRKYGPDVDYLSVVEPQCRGAWHCHVLIRHNDGKKVYIPSKQLEQLWGHGFIKVKALNGVDNIGAYLSAYLGDVELTQETLPDYKKGQEIKTVQVDGVDKHFIKGGRLHLYPPGMNLYRHSSGIVYPEIHKMQYQGIKEIVGTATPNYSCTINIIDDEVGRLLNSVTYEQYNTKFK